MPTHYSFYLVSEIYYKVADSMRNSGNIAPGEWRLSVRSLYVYLQLGLNTPCIIEEVTVNC